MFVAVDERTLFNSSPILAASCSLAACLKFLRYADICVHRSVTLQRSGSDLGQETEARLTS
jgi:hypothetical protein